jgi:hypothetical protein
MKLTKKLVAVFMALTMLLSLTASWPGCKA